jgi:hypothetical protein
METKTKDKELPVDNRPKHAGGAPRKKIKRERSIRVRLSATEHFYIDSKAKSAGMKISDWFRAAAKSAKVIQRLTHQDRLFLHDLSGMANNLNQLAKKANSGGFLTISKMCVELMKQIGKVIKSLRGNDGKDS